ncbi:MAG TPA: hypothetical protein VN903_18160 [Polyangia bacterium]|nr:hypothetical protein [Polyangia bacterium]
MNALGRQVLAAIAVLTLGGFAAGCNDEEAKGSHQIWFMGSIYNGATGEIVNGYEISLTYGTTTIKGKVDENTGRYTLGPLPAWNDYAVTINAPYMRGFVSYNGGIAPPTPPPASQQSDVYTANTTQTFDFDAYVFPADLPSSQLTVNILKADPTAGAAEGKIRLRPTTASVIQDQAAGVTGQVWSNDQDILAAVVNHDFSGGTIVVAAEELVYGVTYQITVYGVSGYQTGTATVRAGLQDSTIVNITTTASPLVLVSNTATACKPYGTSTTVSNTAQITFTFNSPIEDVTTTVGKGPEALDNGISVSTLMGATLKTNASTAVQERGGMFLVNGSTLTISFNPVMGILTQYPNDTIQYVIYSNLSSILLQPIGHPELVKSLSTLTNMSSIQCYM